MKIRVLAEEIVYLEYFVDVPEEILEDSKGKLSKTYLKGAIHNWLDENESEFNFQDYDSFRGWVTWEKVEEND